MKRGDSGKERAEMTGVLAGQRVLITGAAAGFGRATAELFVSEGAFVLGMDREWHDEAPDGVMPFEGDVTSDTAVDEAVRRAAGDAGVDVVIANAGTGVYDDWRTTKSHDWLRVLDVNVTGVMRCFRAGALNMIDHGRGGRLLATGSIAAARPFADGGSYCASKAAVKALVESAALAFAGDRITVNAVAPGSADTALYRLAMRQIGERQGRSADEMQAQGASSVPLGRLVEADDIARLFLFLASDAGRFITGTTVTCDGGSSLT